MKRGTRVATISSICLKLNEFKKKIYIKNKLTFFFSRQFKVKSFGVSLLAFQFSRRIKVRLSLCVIEISA